MASSRFCPSSYETAYAIKDQFNATSTKFSETDNTKFKTVPICISCEVASQRNNDYLDVLEDLEQNVFTATFQSQIYKNSPKKRGKAGEPVCFNIDFEKKREIMIEKYKAIFARNNDINKLIESYKKVCFDKKKILYDPDELPCKGESYTDKFAINSLLLRFAFLIEPGFKRQHHQIFEKSHSRPQSVQVKRPNQYSHFPLHSQFYGQHGQRDIRVRKVTTNTTKAMDSPEKTAVRTQVTQADQPQQLAVTSVNFFTPSYTNEQAKLAFDQSAVRTNSKSPRPDNNRTARRNDASAKKLNEDIPQSKQFQPERQFKVMTEASQSQRMRRRVIHPSENWEGSTSFDSNQRNYSHFGKTFTAGFKKEQFSQCPSHFASTLNTAANSRTNLDENIEFCSSHPNDISQDLISRKVVKKTNGARQKISKIRSVTPYVRRTQRHPAAPTFGSEQDYDDKVFQNVTQTGNRSRTPDLMISLLQK